MDHVIGDAALSLARLWQRQGKRNDVRQLLADVYNWCTKGFETADLQEARALWRLRKRVGRAV